MPVYTVERPGGTKDQEYQAYVDLLEEIGIDITNVPRTPEPGTTNRWLYVWRDSVQAERFARELQRRTRDPLWRVHEFELRAEEHGPLAPLTILSIPTSEGTAFRLEPNSQERLTRHYPNAPLAGEIFLSERDWEALEQQQGTIWNQLVKWLTGMPDQLLGQLGGIRVVDEDGAVLYERLPGRAA